MIRAIDRDHETRMRRKLSLSAAILPTKFWMTVVAIVGLLTLPIAILSDPYKYYYGFALLGGWLAFVTVFVLRGGVVAERMRQDDPHD